MFLNEKNIWTEHAKVEQCAGGTAGAGAYRLKRNGQWRQIIFSIGHITDKVCSRPNFEAPFQVFLRSWTELRENWTEHWRKGDMWFSDGSKDGLWEWGLQCMGLNLRYS